MIDIIPGDLSDPRIVRLLSIHLEWARAASPRCSAHALDLAGLQAPDISFWAAWEGEALAGVGTLRRLTADHGEVKSMHTARAARGRGVGSAMLRHLIAAAQARGFSRLSLETGSMAHFQPARALYRRFGFTDCEPFADYRPDPNSVFMSLDLRRAREEGTDRL